MPPGCLAFFLISLFLVFLPFFLANVAMTALARLGLSPGLAFIILIAIALGSAVNIPVKKLSHKYNVHYNSVRMFGLGHIFPQFIKEQNYTTIAVNLGGCIIPLALASYQILRIATLGVFPVALTILAIALNVIVCYNIARPIRGKGIVMRPFIPGILAALSAILLVPDFAPPVAFTAGVLGPVIGADLLHLKDLWDSPAGTASIGGAGTFDGIVISGLLALLLV